jgi:pyruvate dehydrogenase E2 component (dihydrolipoamide acetyltransferase)
VVKELKVKLGDTVNIGDLVAILEGRGPAHRRGRRSAGAAAHRSGPGSGCSPAAAPAAAAVPAHNPPARPVGLPHASPSVRKFARELGVPLDEVKGSGPKGRITQDDVQAFTKAVMAAPRRPRPRRPRRRLQAGGGGASWACCPGPRSTSPSSARSSARTCRASRRSAAPTCTATGS